MMNMLGIMLQAAATESCATKNFDLFHAASGRLSSTAD